jgi:hypothetical protein
MSRCPNANRHSNELAANANIARLVSNTMFAVDALGSLDGMVLTTAILRCQQWQNILPIGVSPE